MPAESLSPLRLWPTLRPTKGTSGIINIVLKKTGKQATMEVVVIMVSDGSTPGRNARYKYKLQQRKSRCLPQPWLPTNELSGGSETNRYSLAGTDTLSLFESRHYNEPVIWWIVSARWCGDYHLNEKNTISLGGFGMIEEEIPRRQSQNKTTDFTNGSLLRNYLRNNSDEDNHPGMNLSLDYKYDIDKKRIELSCEHCLFKILARAKAGTNSPIY